MKIIENESGFSKIILNENEEIEILTSNLKHSINIKSISNTLHIEELNEEEIKNMNIEKKEINKMQEYIKKSKE